MNAGLGCVWNATELGGRDALQVSSRPVRSLEAAGFYGRGQADLLEDGPGLRALPMDLPRKPRERPKIPVVDDDDGPQRVAAPIVAPRQDISGRKASVMFLR